MIIGPVPATAAQSGWVEVRSLPFVGVTPAASMSLTDEIGGGSYTATLSATAGWSAVAGGMRYQPATAGANLDVDLDALLGATWQSAGVLLLWDLTISLTGGAVVVTALVGAATDLYMILGASAWTAYVGATSGPTAAVTASSQRVQGMQAQATSTVFYRSETAEAEPAALTELAQASYQRLSATVPLTGLKARLGLDEPGGATLDVTVARLRVYARYGL
jgi:hypothetical protein